MSAKLDKDEAYYSFVGTTDAAFGTGSYSLHRQRRKVLNRFFSPAVAGVLEDRVQKGVQQLCARLETLRGTKQPVLMGSAFRAVATDIISQYVLPQGFRVLESDDLGKDQTMVNHQLSRVGSWHRHLGFVLPMLMAMPKWLLGMVASPAMREMLKVQLVSDWSLLPNPPL